MTIFGYGHASSAARFIGVSSCVPPSQLLMTEYLTLFSFPKFSLLFTFCSPLSMAMALKWNIAWSILQLHSNNDTYQCRRRWLFSQWATLSMVIDKHNIWRVKNDVGLCLFCWLHFFVWHFCYLCSKKLVPMTHVHCIRRHNLLQVLVKWNSSCAFAVGCVCIIEQHFIHLI